MIPLPRLVFERVFAYLPDAGLSLLNLLLTASKRSDAWCRTQDLVGVVQRLLGNRRNFIEAAALAGYTRVLLGEAVDSPAELLTRAEMRIVLDRAVYGARMGLAQAIASRGARLTVAQTMQHFSSSRERSLLVMHHIDGYLPLSDFCDFIMHKRQLANWPAVRILLSNGGFDETDRAMDFTLGAAILFERTQFAQHLVENGYPVTRIDCLMATQCRKSEFCKMLWDKFGFPRADIDLIVASARCALETSAKYLAYIGAADVLSRMAMCAITLHDPHVLESIFARGGPFLLDKQAAIVHAALSAPNVNMLKVIKRYGFERGVKIEMPETQLMSFDPRLAEVLISMGVIVSDMRHLVYSVVCASLVHPLYDKVLSALRQRGDCIPHMHALMSLECQGMQFVSKLWNSLLEPVEM